MRRVILLCALPLLASGVEGCDARKNATADLVFVNGGVYTADDRDSSAEGVAVAEGVIVYVGSSNGARAFVGDATRVIDLTGHMLMPGFHDAHAHVLAAGLTATSCDLQDLREVDAIRRRLEECRDQQDYGAGEWVIGARWALAAFPDGSPPKAWLDEVFENRPAYFIDSFAHSAWVSSRALEIAGIDATTPDPPDGRIERDDEGQPTGTLRDGAMELVARHMPAESDEDLDAALASGLREVARYGITAYTEPGLDEVLVQTYLRADRAERLTARVLGSLSTERWEAHRFDESIYGLLERHAEFRGRYFSADSVKVYVDGVIETKTSYMLEPYEGGENAPPFYAPSELAELYRRIDAMGLQIHTHAIGDGAIRVALDAYEHALKENGATDNRHQIAHLQLIDEADIPRFAKLGVAADFQGLWAYPDDYIDVAIPLVGAERVARFYPVGSVHRAGGMLVGGSDWDVSSLNPLDAIETLVRRQDPYADTGPTLGSGEEIDLATALAAYTRNAAWVMRLDDRTGSIAEGRRADLVVLDRNLFDVPATQINEARVLMTIMDGRTVYEDAPAP